MAKKTYDCLLKLLLIGDSDVGKTTILFRFGDDAFNSTFVSTVGIDFKVKTIELQGKRIKLQIWDTAGQQRFHTINTSYYRGAHGAMLVYDITNSRSFENLKKWTRNVEEHRNENFAMIVVGNNFDMEERRQVSINQGIQFALEHKFQFFEVSANANINVEYAFYKFSEAALTEFSGPWSTSMAEPNESSHTLKVNEEVQPLAKSRCSN